MQHNTDNENKGPIAWMTRHAVAANLLMVLCLLGGWLVMKQIKQEFMPAFQIDTVTVSVVYQGASPEEVENGVLLAIENAISGVDGIAEVRATAKEGLGTVLIDALSGTDIEALNSAIQKEIERITTFPEGVEKPQVKIVNRQAPLLIIAVYGNAATQVLHELSEQLRDRLLQEESISRVDVLGVRPLELSISVSQEQLRRYHLTLSDIAQRITAASVDFPSGSVRTTAGEILLRVKERKDYVGQFAKLPIISGVDGSEVLLGDIARFSDAYEASDYAAFYNGQPTLLLSVFNTGEQTPEQVSLLIREHLRQAQASFPAGVKVDVRSDMSEQYTDRVNLLTSNSAQGIVLVFIVLALFLELRLAFWVMMGIPTTFLGSFLLLPLFGVSLNMISLFAFVIALDIVVDDAIVIGENIYDYRQQGLSPMQAAIKGAQDVATPVSFSILTNGATFAPFFFIPGEMGRTFFEVPIVVLIVFFVSLIESLFILPNHLAHLRELERSGVWHWLTTLQQRFSAAFMRGVARYYGGFLNAVLRRRYFVVLCIGLLLLVTLTYVLSGRIDMTALPRTEADYAKLTISMPYGTPLAKTQRVAKHATDVAYDIAKQLPNGEQLIKGAFTEIGRSNNYKAELRIYLAPPHIREKIISTEQFNQRWRDALGELAGVKSTRFESDAGGPGGGSSISIELNHPDIATLAQASKELAEILKTYPLIKDVDDGFSAGKQQLDFVLLPEGKSLGFTAASVARQVRNAFYGAQVLRQQRGRNELTVRVRLPDTERLLESDLENLLLRTNSGKDIPLREVVTIKRGHAYTSIERHDGRRNVQVTANVVPRSQSGKILNDLEANHLPQLLKRYAGLRYSLEGQAADAAESLSVLKISFVFSLLAVYSLLAIVFANYLLPLTVIIAIPFGTIGAIFGHLLLGLELSIVSLLGIMALSGVVVNDSVILIDHVSKLHRDNTQNTLEVIQAAAIDRFRPIVLTTLTTFGGLMPMILETSRQARLIVPMAVSIGFGVLFATVITLILIPCLYLLVDDWRRWRAR